MSFVRFATPERYASSTVRVRRVGVWVGVILVSAACGQNADTKADPAVAQPTAVAGMQSIATAPVSGMTAHSTGGALVAAPTAGMQVAATAGVPGASTAGAPTMSMAPNSG